jgi:hypothetical protein
MFEMYIVIIVLLFVIQAIVVGVKLYKKGYKNGVISGRKQILREDLIRLGIKEKTSDVNSLDKMYDIYSKRLN